MDEAPPATWWTWEIRDASGDLGPVGVCGDRMDAVAEVNAELRKASEGWTADVHEVAPSPDGGPTYEYRRHAGRASRPVGVNGILWQ
ncbi:hypothetical protein DFJ69_2792 [Thermomonospora umbrina]|uniref:Uncharacterized protein n=1 Tax=Thermomonospora umbrina TaxID=111806 RepID=A0A3D9SWF6_9ACTN|nr:hypothetical protein DFJ69_2792 [Thermomonospora umbrina]